MASMSICQVFGHFNYDLLKPTTHIERKYQQVDAIKSLQGNASILQPEMTPAGGNVDSGVDPMLILKLTNWSKMSWSVDQKLIKNILLNFISLSDWIKISNRWPKSD